MAIGPVAAAVVVGDKAAKGGNNLVKTAKHVTRNVKNFKDPDVKQKNFDSVMHQHAYTAKLLKTLGVKGIK